MVATTTSARRLLTQAASTYQPPTNTAQLQNWQSAAANPTPTGTGGAGTGTVSTYAGPTPPPVNSAAGVTGVGATGAPVLPAGTGSYNAGMGQGTVPWFGDDWTGAASRYAPGYADILLSNPSQIFYDRAKQMGMMRGGDLGAVRMLEPLAQVAPAFYALLQASQPNLFSAEAQTNWMDRMAREYLTPGGSALSTMELFNSIFNGPQAVQDLFRTGNPSQNVNALNDMLGAVAGQSYNPLLQRMMQGATDRAGYEYLSRTTQGRNPGPYDDWMQRYLGSYGWMP